MPWRMDVILLSWKPFGPSTNLDQILRLAHAHLHVDQFFFLRNEAALAAGGTATDDTLWGRRVAWQGWLNSPKVSYNVIVYSCINIHILWHYIHIPMLRRISPFQLSDISTLHNTEAPAALLGTSMPGLQRCGSCQRHRRPTHCSLDRSRRTSVKQGWEIGCVGYVIAC